MRPKQWSTSKLPTSEIEKLWKLLQKGWSLKELAKKRGTTTENIAYLLKSRGFPTRVDIQKKCQLPECGKDFQSTMGRGRFCCRQHMKLHFSREERGVISTLVLCALPECDNKIWMTHPGRRPGFGGNGGSGKRYCCKEHGNKHSHRRLKGVYKNLLGLRGACEVCGETLILDEHHEEFTRKGSNKQSKTHLLCPTHHMMIHRGWAIFQSGKFVRIDRKAKEGIKRRLKLFNDYKATLGLGSGHTWGTAK
jgi:hypothetical protein